jgi:hypothetical protein
MDQSSLGEKTKETVVGCWPDLKRHALTPMKEKPRSVSLGPCHVLSGARRVSGLSVYFYEILATVVLTMKIMCVYVSFHIIICNNTSSRFENA